MNRYSYTTDSSYTQKNSLGANLMDDLIQLINTDIPDGRNSLRESFTNLERVAEYCEDNYYRSGEKKASLEETKNYTTQSLASVAYQINTLAYNFLQLLDLQATQLEEMESQINHISQTVQIHKEKVARREIGVLTANKVSTRQYKIVAPLNPEKPIKYVRKPIDYSILDDVGHGLTLGSRSSMKMRGSSQGSISIQGSIHANPPTTKPPTPPVGRSGTLSKAGNTGTLGKSSREYRTPPVVVPPQVPSHYAPNYPMGHPRRQDSGGSRGPGYSALPITGAPMPPSQVQVMQQQPPQVGMVHPMQPHHPPQQQLVPPPTSSYDERNSMPPPPSPLTVTHELPDHLPMSGHIGMHTLSRNMPRPGSQSPPLPPPPPPEEHADFGRPRTAAQQAAAQQQSNLVPGSIVPDDQNLPGWVPKNYIEKVVAIYDYYADKDDELSFQESSVIYVLKKNDDGWCYGWCYWPISGQLRRAMRLN